MDGGKTSFKALRRNGRFDRDRSDLLQRMDAGVGASRPLGKSFFAGQVFDSGHQSALDRWTIGLHLPSREIIAVICQRELEIAPQTAAPNIF